MTSTLTLFLNIIISSRNAALALNAAVDVTLSPRRFAFSSPSMWPRGEGLTNHGPNSVYYQNHIPFPGMCGPQNPKSSSSCMLEHWFCITSSAQKTWKEERLRRKSARRGPGCDPRYHKCAWMNKMLVYTCNNTIDD